MTSIQPDDASPCRVSVLGSVARLERDGSEWVPERRTAALLALLALEGPLPRERAAALLFPDAEPARARANLRQLLYRLRRFADILRDDPLAFRPGVAVDALAIADQAVVDQAVADQTVAEHAAAEAAHVLGEPLSLLGSFAYDDLPEVEERLAFARRHFREGLRAAMFEQARQAELEGDANRASASARKLLALDPTDEEAACMLMRLQLEVGDAAGVLSTFRRVRDALDTSFGATPAAATVDLAERAAGIASSPLRMGGANQDRLDPARTATGPMVRIAEAGGWIAEAAGLLKAAASTLEPGPERGRILVQIAWLEHQLGRHDAARAAAETGLSLLDARESDSARVEGLFVLGSIALVEGDRGAAGELWREALDLAGKRAGGTDDLALLLNLAMVEDGLGRAKAALEWYLQALSLAERVDDRHSTIVILNNIGHSLSSRGRHEEARPLLLRAASLAEDGGERRLRAYVMESLASCELSRGAPQAARGLAAWVLAEGRAIGDPVIQVEGAVTIAEADDALGDAASALRTVRAALGLARSHGYANEDLSGVKRGLQLVARLTGQGHVDAARDAAPGAAPDAARDATPHPAPEAGPEEHW